MRSKRGLLALTAILALPLSAGASDMKEKSLVETLSESRAIVHGRVIDQYSQWERFGGNEIIFTYSTIQVENAQLLKMNARDHVVVRTVGGTVNGYTQLLIDEASFRLGEEVVTFLTLEEDWFHLSVTNFRHGKYSVVRDANGRIEGLRKDPGQQVDPKLRAMQPVIPRQRFAADLRQAFAKLRDGDTSDITPLTPVR